MPVPTPAKGESQNAFISRCISALKKSDPERPDKQIQAICYSTWKKGGTKGVRGGDRGGPRDRPLNRGGNMEFIKIPICEFRKVEDGVLEKVTEYSFHPDKFTEEQAKKWIKKAVSPKTKGDFGAWCKSHGFGGVNQACVNAAAKAGGRSSKMALFAVNVSKGKYTYPKGKK